jgi:hypothetical protein
MNIIWRRMRSGCKGNGEHCLKLPDHLVLTLVCQWDSYEELRFMQRRALPLQFALPVFV